MNIIKNDIELSNFEFNNFYEKSRKLIFNTMIINRMKI